MMAEKHPGRIRQRCPECGKRTLLVGVYGENGGAAVVACEQTGGCGWKEEITQYGGDPRDGKTFIRGLKRAGRVVLGLERKKRDFWRGVEKRQAEGKKMLDALTLPRYKPIKGIVRSTLDACGRADDREGNNGK